MADALAAALLGEASGAANSDSRAKGTPKTDVAREPHALAATLRNDEANRSGPFSPPRGLAGTAKWIAAIALVVAVGVVVGIVALDGRGKKADANVQAASLGPQPPGTPAVASAAASAPPAPTLSPNSTPAPSSFAPAPPFACAPRTLVLPLSGGSSPVAATSPHPTPAASAAARPPSARVPLRTPMASSRRPFLWISTTLRRSRRRAVLALALSLALTPASAALAQPQEPGAPAMATARTLYKEGKELRDKGDLKGALQKFQAAHALGQTPVTGIELARTYAAVGRFVEAREVCLWIGRTPVAGDETSKSADARADAAKLAEDMKPRIGSLLRCA